MIKRATVQPSLTLHSHVKTRMFSPTFCMELLNIFQVINFYSQFWRVRACIFFEKCMCMHEHTLHEYTQNCTSTHSHARDTSRVYFVIHLMCTVDIVMHGR